MIVDIPQQLSPRQLPRLDPGWMRGWFAHRDSADRDAADLGKLDDLLLSLQHVMADRACCCPARPVITVIMPPAPRRPHPVDLLLCDHHFRISQAALTAVGVPPPAAQPMAPWAGRCSTRVSEEGMNTLW